MSPGVYVIDEGGGLVEMTEQPYDSEALLQQLLEDYPNLLAGDQMGVSEPRRWVLVEREAGIASELEGSGRWSADHVFLDQSGIPTLVEVKRSSDTRLRREVVGQMLDYAANAVVYWPIEGVRASFEATCERRGQDPGQAVAELTGDGGYEDFWQLVRTNLHAGRVRMVFVADVIPAELQRIVEFLNEQMSSAEVFAVEIKQFVGEGRKTLVPRVIGQTAAATQTKSAAGDATTWDEESFFAKLEEEHGPDDARVARAILEWAKPRFTRIWWGKGRRSGSYFPMLDHAGESYRPIAVWTYGTVEIQFEWLQHRRPFDWPDKRLELARRLNQIPGIAIPEDSISRRPSFPLSVLVDENQLESLLQILDWVLSEIRAVRPNEA